MLLTAYRIVSWLAAPLIGLYLHRRLAKGREHPERFPERLGHASLPRPPGRLLWCHAASVGEALSVLPLLEQFGEERPDWTRLLTTGTLTSAEVVAQHGGEALLHQFVPVDRPDAVGRFLDHWQPSLAIWVESELWPNLVRLTRARGVPMALVNARMSARSAKSWKRWPNAVRRLLGAFDVILAQSAADARRFLNFGVLHVTTLGNLKSAAAPLPVDDREYRKLKAAIGDRPCWLAASIHPEEIEEVALVQRYFAKHHADFLTLIVPRHPQRGIDWLEVYFRDQKAGLRSRQDWPNGAVYIADTLGELGLFYRLAPVSFVGGSLAPLGGHNPLEPARLGSAVLFGPHREAFCEVSQALRSVGGAHEVKEATDIVSAVLTLRKDPALRGRMVEAAARMAVAENRVIDDVLGALRPLLPPEDDARA